MGLLVGYVRRDHAAIVSPLVQHSCRGALEARGLIVGGWKNEQSEGHYGIRVCITANDVARLGLDPSQIPPAELERDRAPVPTFSVGADETRLTPSSPHALPTTVTVTEEEHYQDAILRSRPDPWDREWWPVLVTLDVTANPHAKAASERVRVRIGDDTVGFFTAAMTTRHVNRIQEVWASGKRPTATGEAHKGAKHGEKFWRLKLALALPEDTEVTLVPSRILNVRTRTNHWDQVVGSTNSPRSTASRWVA